MGNALRAQTMDDISADETNLLDDFVLARIAPAGGATRGDVARDLAPFATHRLSPSEFRSEVDLSLAAAVDRGYATSSRGRYQLTSAGEAVALDLLGGRTLPKDWPEIRDVRLPARALGLAGDGPQRYRALSRPDGLRAAVLQQAYKIKGKRTLSSARLRAALAGVALERAFGNRIKGDIAAGEGLSARAGRLLAAQLAGRPRDFGTDSRLIAVLAAEAAGAVQNDLAALRLAVLRNAISRRLPQPNAPKTVTAERRATAPAVEPRPAPGRRPPAASRPDLKGFADTVLAVAEPFAEGWPGNRKTLIVHVWEALQDAHPEWGLNEIEFKAMLTEAHRTGHIVLANADLKSKSNAREIQASAITFKNTVWHFVRIES